MTNRFVVLVLHFLSCDAPHYTRTVDEFVAYWQTKRDQSRRGIIEVTRESE